MTLTVSMVNCNYSLLAIPTLLVAELEPVEPELAKSKLAESELANPKLAESELPGFNLTEAERG